MKHLILSIAMLATGCLSAAALPVTYYAPQSVLRAGKWVKVGVEESGIYEITFDELSSLGFNDPSAVSVYGRGGKQMAQNFTDENGNILIDNDLSQVPTFCSDNKLFFYAVGVQEFEMADIKYEELPAYFVNKGKNIYSRRGYYFLTDSSQPLHMSSLEVTDSEPNPATFGYDYIYHEKDLALNNSNTGQFFWGENFLPESQRRQSWGYSLNNMITGTPTVMDCQFYAPKTSHGVLSFGMENAGQNAVLNYVTTTWYYFRPLTPMSGVNSFKSYTSITGAPASGNIFVEYAPNTDDDYANLDFWTVTYKKTIPTLLAVNGEKLSQERITFHNVNTEKAVTFTMPDGYNFQVMDVSNPACPRMVDVKQNGSDGIATFTPSCENPSLIVFDPRRSQYQFKGYKTNYNKIANQDLHQEASKGAELIIICAEQLRAQAERLADIHRQHDNARVIVATVDEVYNEFSAGVPDPMAYRSFAKMTYLSDQKLKNILLFGPITNDLRGTNVERDPFNNIIAYQNPLITVEKGAANVNDFYGMMADYFNTNLEMQDMQIGVGILPCSFVAEANRVIDKIERYITDDSFAYTLSEFLAIGGLGDDHVHDQQAIDLGNYINISNNSHMVLSTLIIDAYGSKAARKKLFEYFDAGKEIAVYFGHGGPTMLGKDKNFFSADQISLLRNTRLPFMMFAGCEITNTDRGQRGIGESLVTATDYGLIGSVVATRDTWSGLNLEFMKILTNRFYKDGNQIDSPRLTSPLTTGEVFARAKTQSKSTNELNYQLICDPALIVPVANRRIQYSASTFQTAPGETFTLTGHIVDVNNGKDTDYNGEIVLKLLEPSVTLVSADLETNSIADGHTCKVDYRDYVANMYTTTVKDGTFSIDITVPQYMTEFVGKDCLLVGTAYDASRRLGAGTRVTVKIKEPSSELPVIVDNVAPVIERFEFDKDKNVIRFSVSDDTALDLSSSPFSNSFYMTVDGRSYTLGTNSPKLLQQDRIAYDKIISTAHLTKGVHNAKITVRDLAGNKTTSELSFSIGDDAQPFALLCEDAISHDACRLYIEGNPRNPRLIISDSCGNRVVDTEFNGLEFIWDKCDNNGNLLPAGLYKAYIIESGNHSDKKHSDIIDLPVI